MRAAMVGGGAYYMGKKSQQAKEQEYEQEERIAALEGQQAQSAPASSPAPAPAAAASGTAPTAGSDLVEKLKELKGLLDAGALSQDEFDTAKKKLLGA